MALAAWWSCDPTTELPTLNGFHVAYCENDAEIAQINRISETEVNCRRQAGHRPYVGYLNSVPVTYGWSATQEAAIGELNLNFAVPAGNRYLWDFATLPEWQGYGLYPRLLQGILSAEQAERFWIIHAPENLPSGAGMHKAGFQAVGQLSFLHDGTVGLLPFDMHERAQIGAALLGVPLIEGGLSPCWRCVDQLICTCHLHPESCSCAFEIRSR